MSDKSKSNTLTHKFSEKQTKTKNKLVNKTASQSKPKFKSQFKLDEFSSSSESENNLSDDESASNDVCRSSSKTHSRPFSVLKNSFDKKLSKQDNRITDMENNLTEAQELWNGKNLNDLWASSGPKLAIKLAVAIKGADLKDCVLTEDGEESPNSTRIPWCIEEIAVFRRVMMRKCRLNSEQFSKKFSTYRSAVNGRSRYDHKEHLKRLGVKPKTRRANFYSKSKKNIQVSSDEDDASQSITSHSKSKTVSFSTPVSQSIKSTHFTQASLSINKTKVAATCVDNTLPLEPTAGAVAAASTSAFIQTKVAAACVDNTLPLQPTAGAAAAAHDLNAMTPSILNYFKKVRKTSTRNSNEK